jgi:hypothetical protein
LYPVLHTSRTSDHGLPQTFPKRQFGCKNHRF